MLINANISNVVSICFREIVLCMLDHPPFQLCSTNINYDVFIVVPLSRYERLLYNTNVVYILNWYAVMNR